MQDKVITCEAHESPAHALNLMRHYQVRHVPVVSAGHFVGLLSIRDLFAVVSGLQN